MDLNEIFVFGTNNKYYINTFIWAAIFTWGILYLIFEDIVQASLLLMALGISFFIGDSILNDHNFMKIIRTKILEINSKWSVSSQVGGDGEMLDWDGEDENDLDSSDIGDDDINVDGDGDVDREDEADIEVTEDVESDNINRTDDTVEENTGIEDEEDEDEDDDGDIETIHIDQSIGQEKYKDKGSSNNNNGGGAGGMGGDLLSGLFGGGGGGVSGMLGGLFGNSAPVPKPVNKGNGNMNGNANGNNTVRLKEPHDLDELLGDIGKLSEASLRVDDDLTSHVTGTTGLRNIQTGSTKRRTRGC